MKLTFIGSSHGVPEPNRKCSCTMVTIGQRNYFVDMGTMGVDALRVRGIPVESVEGIFITHMHGDHTNGLPQFVDLITWFYKNADPVICLPNIDAAKVITDWITVIQNGNTRQIQYRQIQPGVVFDDGVLKVTAISTQHCEKSYAFLLEAEGKRVLFTGDLKNPKADFPEVDGVVDLAILECAHFPATDYIPVLEKATIEKLCVHHYSNRWLPSVFELKNTYPLKLVTDDLEVTV